MSPEIFYFIKANLIIIAAYLLYKVMFKGEHGFRFRRIFLLSSMIGTLLLPALGLFLAGTHINEGIIMMPAIDLSEMGPTAGNGTVTENSLPIMTLLSYIYIAISALLVLRTLWRIISIHRLIRKAQRTELTDGIYTHLIMADTETAFSWFNHIFISYRSDVPEFIIAHELAHVSHRHSADIIISELFTSLFWINPAAWGIRNCVRENLEFMADAHAVNESNRREYQMCLLNNTIQSAIAPIYTNFNLTSIKKRIIMMNNKPRKTGRVWKSLLAIAALAGIIVVSATAMAANTPAESSKVTRTTRSSKSQTKKVKTQTLKTSKTAYASTAGPDDASFPGGAAEFFMFVAKNIEYPQSAIKDGTEGQVIVNFTVAPDGKVTDVKVVKGVREDLDKAALEVIKKSPKWNPAKPGGDASVNVPVNFKLSPNPKKSK